MPSDVPQSPDLASAQSHPQAAPVRVFISYTHDSPAHQQEMLSLSDRLRRDGVDCTIYLYEDSLVEGWPAWMLRQIETSDFVLAVCTEAYYRRVMEQERPGVGLGARWEGRHILQSMYDAGGNNASFIPIVPSSGDVAHIPLPLRGATYYRPHHTDEYDRLLRRLTAQPALVKPPVGKVLPSPHDLDKHSGPSRGMCRFAAKAGRKVAATELASVDLVVCGSVAVNRQGARIGKGGGFSDLEVAFLVEADVIRPDTVLATTVHALQVVDEPLPETIHDFRVDLIVTPDEAIWGAEPHRPPGILWDHLDDHKIAEVPALAALSARR